MQKIIIMGAGVGGLVAAHELSKLGIYDIHVYDRNHMVGGQSRSSIQDGKHSEYCWHAISSGYTNLPTILSEIMLDDDKSTVLDNLKPLKSTTFSRIMVPILNIIRTSYLAGCLDF